jgi:hypothetical protein
MYRLLFRCTLQSLSREDRRNKETKKDITYWHRISVVNRICTSYRYVAYLWLWLFFTGLQIRSLLPSAALTKRSVEMDTWANCCRLITVLSLQLWDSWKEKEGSSAPEGIGGTFSYCRSINTWVYTSRMEFDATLTLEQMLSWYPKLHVVLHASHAALQMIR